MKRLFLCTLLVAGAIFAGFYPAFDRSGNAPGKTKVAGSENLSGRQNEAPNIIFVLTDDQRWDAMGAMGNPIIQTPNLDRLAEDGLMFRNAYVTTAICMVSRASILSGQYMSRHQIDNFSKNFQPEAFAKTYPMLLKKAGYTIGFTGKFGVGNQPPEGEFDFWSCTNKGQPPYHYETGGGRVIHHTDSVGNDVREFLDMYADESKAGKPFCLSVSFKAPHELDGDPPTYPVQERYKDLYSDVHIPVPETADPAYWNSFPDFFRTDDNIARKRWTALFSTPELFQENVKNYYRLVTGVDEVIGNMREQLKRLGLDKNTIIIFMGDNGFYLGEHGMEGKWYGHEESIRVPLLVYDPRPGGLQGAQDLIALNVDIAPTILELAGLPVPAGMQGQSLIAMLKDPGLRRQDFYYEHTFMGSPGIPKVEGVVSRGQKYMNFTEHGYEQLFDLRSDPHETTNLAGEPAAAGDLEKMRARYRELKASVK